MRRGPPAEVASPAAHVDAGEDQFPAAGGDESADLAEDAFFRKAARAAAGLGNDAETAAVAAALLDLQVGAGLGSGNDLGFFKKGVGEAVVGEAKGCYGRRGLEGDERR